MIIKLNLDENIDKNLLDELRKLANGGSLPKALYLYIYDLAHFRAYSGQIQTQNDQIQTQIEPKSPSVGPDALAGALADIEEEW